MAQPTPAKRRTRADESPERAERRRRRLLATSRVLRATRATRHMVQEQVADRAGISKGHVGRMESPRGILSQGDLTLIRLWDVLDSLHMSWAEWEAAVKREMALEDGSAEAVAAPGVRDSLVTMVANIARSIPLGHLELLADFARTLDRHRSSLDAIPADWQADADRAARAAKREAVDGELDDGRERASRIG